MSDALSYRPGRRHPPSAGTRSIAVIGASARPDSFGRRMVTEVLRSPGAPRVHLINPRYDSVDRRPCLPSLADVGDLVVLGVPDHALRRSSASRRSAATARLSSSGRRRGWGPTSRPSPLAAQWRCAVPGAWDSSTPLAASALLRTHRRLAYSLAVSAGQELVTSTADYLHYALELEESRVVALFSRPSATPTA